MQVDSKVTWKKSKWPFCNSILSSRLAFFKYIMTDSRHSVNLKRDVSFSLEYVKMGTVAFEELHRRNRSRYV